MVQSPGLIGLGRSRLPTATTAGSSRILEAAIASSAIAKAAVLEAAIGTITAVRNERVGAFDLGVAHLLAVHALDAGPVARLRAATALMAILIAKQQC